MYRMIFVPNHPRADVTGLVPEHILIAEKVLGRSLTKDEIVHHKDFNKLNNSPLNLLFPITRLEHQQLPLFQARFIIAMNLYTEFLEFWKQEQERIEQNKDTYELEHQLVKAQNLHQRIQYRLWKEENK